MNRRPAPDGELADRIRSSLTEAADPALAPGMAAYMKSAMPYAGVRVPEVRRLVRQLVDEAGRDERPGVTDRATWEATVRTLYDSAAVREQRYAALALAGHRRVRAWQDPDVLTLHRHLATSGAWWDLVDWTANLTAGVLRGHSAAVAPVLRDWATDDDLWVRRVAILSQLGRKADLDQALLEDCLAPNLARTEFWLRKACGWALRDASYHHPEWVRSYVEAHAQVLAPLTRREALRALDRADRRATSDRPSATHE